MLIKKEDIYKIGKGLIKKEGEEMKKIGKGLMKEDRIFTNKLNELV